MSPSLTFHCRALSANCYLYMSLLFTLFTTKVVKIPENTKFLTKY